ncbi:unnamed protein product [Boreogadus saida]
MIKSDEEIQNTDPCDPTPCVNGAQCKALFAGIVCECVYPYHGNTCEKVVEYTEKALEDTMNLVEAPILQPNPTAHHNRGGASAADPYDPPSPDHEQLPSSTPQLSRPLSRLVEGGPPPGVSGSLSQVVFPHRIPEGTPDIRGKGKG